MPKVKILRTPGVQNGVKPKFAEGQVVQVTEEEAEALLKAGLCELVGSNAKPTPAPTEPTDPKAGDQKTPAK